MLRALVFSVFIACSVCPALADDAPDFLINKVYSTDTSKCGDSTEDDSLQLSREGVFGYEFGCTFLGFEKDVDQDTGKTYVAVATAHCGDDSGINRPDLISLIVQDEKTIAVQSQNEYVIAETQRELSQRLPDTIKIADEFPDFISREYKLCK